MLYFVEALCSLAEEEQKQDAQLRNHTETYRLLRKVGDITVLLITLEAATIQSQNFRGLKNYAVIVSSKKQLRQPKVPIP